ncbi:MAG: hypothetical protein EZS28_030712 [Streblomastix strix]|uniref:Uncharacterized protein n=1 Tax=Streblomastix strix TaxID=222440 RepID=A0A5J4UV90_9EUKA|nr:MAG: hypothetical protein EZS28_030712 [Streblomastix strix]
MYYMKEYICQLHKGRQDFLCPSFPYQPLLTKLCEEQIEEEGGNEEIESQLINKRYQWDVKNRALEAKREILNFYNDRNNPKPW